MKTILVINDNSLKAHHAITFALAIAQKIQANILIAHTVGLSKQIQVKVGASHGAINITEGVRPPGFKNELGGQADFNPEVEELDISAMDECQVAELINKKQIWMMVKGAADISHPFVSDRNLNAHSVLGKVLCPLLMVPESWPVKAIERMVYIADLRYCHTQIVRYLADLARPWQADVSIANLTAKGLPDMAEEYALSLFEGAVCNRINYEQLFINNIREKDVEKVVDVLINGLHNDILVLVNRQFHFEEIMGRNITDTLPEQITVPLLVFPY
jgi:hypothetical protein